MKLWDKGYDIDRFTEEFTIGKDRELDVMLAKADVLGNMAHLKMLHHIGLISDGELKDLAQGLKDIFAEIESGKISYRGGDRGHPFANRMPPHPKVWGSR